MKITFWGAWALLFALFFTNYGCGSAVPVALDSSADVGGLVSFGTLSDSNDVIEASASVVYTRLAQYRFNAASLLRQKRITLDQARLALKTSDAIRLALDKGVKTRDLLKIQAAGNQLNQAAKQLERGL